MTNPNWKLVVDFAHYSGARRSLLNDAERLELVLLADGFGTLRKCQEHADMLADWSHVRDSSDSAIAAMANWLREKLCDLRRFRRRHPQSGVGSPLLPELLAMKTLGISYCRVSSEEQALEGVSLDAQRAKIEAYAVMRGIELEDIIVDAGVSASKPLEKRAGGAQLIKALRCKKGPKAVIAWKLDRLFRNTADCLNTVESWDRKKINLHLIDLGGSTIDTSTAVGKLFLTMLAGFAEFERNTTSERTIAALAHKRANGERTGAIPFGYTVDDDGTKLIRQPAEQMAIAAILLMRAEGMVITAITEEMNNSDHRPRGQKWHVTTVNRILKKEGQL